MASLSLPSTEQIFQALSYDPETGLFTWNKRPITHFASRKGMMIWNSKYPGRIAGCNDGHGYIKIKIFNRDFLGHRLAWYFTHGEWGDCIDHLDGNRANNKISNLRSVSRAVNQKNQKIHISNTSGHTGVTRAKCGKWKAFIRVDGKQMHLGLFWQKDDAIRCREAADLKYGFHRRNK